MENVITVSNTLKFSWLEKRCRRLVFSLLTKLSQDRVDIIEGNQVHSFGKQKGQQSLHAVIEIFHPKSYFHFLKGGSIGAAEAYIDGLWHSPDLTKVIQVFAKAQTLTDKIEAKTAWLNRISNTLSHFANRNNKQGSKKNILAHYDLGNELYQAFLDPEMMYSSAIYPQPDTSLAEAQLHKLETICQRLDLQAEDHLLEIGTGWGGLAIYAAQHYGCDVTTTTISDAQYSYAKDRISALGLQDKITLLKQDYRELTGQYDKLVSIEMIEAVGYRYMNSFFQQCQSLLKPQGKMLLQAITIADQRFDYYLNNVDFIQRYIFPGGFLPSIHFLSEKLKNNTSMMITSIDDIGLDYARTIEDWRHNFLAAWPQLTQCGFDDKFKRLWLFYLAYCQGGFLQRSISTIHLVASK